MLLVEDRRRVRPAPEQLPEYIHYEDLLAEEALQRELAETTPSEVPEVESIRQAIEVTDSGAGTGVEPVSKEAAAEQDGV